jgi:hypothetical protein
LFLWGDEADTILRMSEKNNIPCTIAGGIHYHHPAAGFTYKATGII